MNVQQKNNKIHLSHIINLSNDDNELLPNPNSLVSPVIIGNNNNNNNINNSSNRSPPYLLKSSNNLDYDGEDDRMEIKRNSFSSLNSINGEISPIISSNSNNNNIIGFSNNPDHPNNITGRKRSIHLPSLSFVEKSGGNNSNNSSSISSPPPPTLPHPSTSSILNIESSPSQTLANFASPSSSSSHHSHFSINDPTTTRLKSHSFSAFENSPPTSPLIAIAHQLNGLKSISASTPPHYSPTSSPTSSPSKSTSSSSSTSLLPTLPKIISEGSGSGSNSGNNSTHTTPNAPMSPITLHNRYSTSVTHSPAYNSPRLQHLRPPGDLLSSPPPLPIDRSPSILSQSHHLYKKRSNSLHIFGSSGNDLLPFQSDHQSLPNNNTSTTTTTSSGNQIKSPPLPPHSLSGTASALSSSSPSPTLSLSNSPQQQSSTPSIRYKTHSHLQFEGGSSSLENYRFEKIPLLIAAYHNDLIGMKTMLLTGADLNYKCSIRGWTPLMFASQRNNLDMIDFLLNQKSIEIDLQNSEGVTALFIACSSSNVDIVRKLLSKGANPNISNKNGTTPLMVSCSLGDKDIVILLLRYNAMINTVDHRGFSSLMYTQIYGYKLNNNDTHYDFKIVYGEMLDQRRDIIQILLSYGSRIDIISNDEWTPLKLAIKHGPLDFVEYIIDMDENLLLETDSQGWTCLNLAIRYSPIEVIDLILKKGYPINSSIQHLVSMTQPQQHHPTPSHEAISPLVLAVQYRALDVIEKLISYGLDVLQQGDPQLIISLCKETNKSEIEKYLTEIIIQKMNPQSQTQQPISSPLQKPPQQQQQPQPTTNVSTQIASPPLSLHHLRFNNNNSPPNLH